ncbi:sigma 54-interacting transcriptional regulator [Nannocystis sp. SCPEA4]|uniref:sigma-54-dependent Fis family transcriptional regulator n=1 Tax=Nannocystis sp. SCPEA4 TaxID=2996787 RepID=UPI00227165F5|nr:sigma 54-interacting transcriptional regulator [Nannocystis sp. SCPEA4]MCY1058407.1 sigma 54-interacting transcriptional regulator [Nannocystis sp. SCPEA4]
MDTDDLLRRGLDWVARIAPYDLAAVFTLDEDSRLVVRAARGHLASQVRGHRIDLANFPTLREALETRRARAFTEDDHRHGDGDPFDGVLDLSPGHACMVVPLHAAGRSLGLLTLDRAHCESYPQAVVDQVETYGQILGLALDNSERRVALEHLRAEELERARESDEVAAGYGVLERSVSPAVRAVAARARQVAPTDTPVLILGETGTGKERLARALHLWSARADRPFVAVNCAAIPASLLESELFGHTRGAFTGATRDRLGRFQLASGGTLLLDEIGELPIELQAKLLRVVQEGVVEPVGSDKSVKVDVRLLAATHVDLEKAIATGRLREDLYYRLAVFPLRLPPLRQRLEDLPLLCAAMLAEQSQRTGRRGMRVSDAGLARLRAHAWPGNLRELSNALERATIVTSGEILGPEAFELGDMPAETGPIDHAPKTSPSEAPLHHDGRIATLEEVSALQIQRVLTHTRGRIYGPGGAAELLGVPPSTLQSRMKKLGVARTA